MQRRSAVNEILAFNSNFPPAQLFNKLDKLTGSPFTFFRATFHLFARDLREGWRRAWPMLNVGGPIIADLHTENFGSFRAVSGDIVYDINDFDEATQACYEIDLRRLTTSILLGALDNGHTFGEGVRASEMAAQSYLETLGRLREIRNRKKFAELTENRVILGLLHQAREKVRSEFMRGLAVESAPGHFVFKPLPSLRPVSAKVRKRATEALPSFLSHVLAPPKARPTQYTLQDIAFRIAGAGALGRARYALLFGKGMKKQEDWSTLRLIEWKAALDSALDTEEPRSGKRRAQEVFAFAQAFQLFPKRYLGYVTMGKQPMQTREIGANDARFDPKSMQDQLQFQRASQMFGSMTARAHLLGSMGQTGPRTLVAKLQGREDRFTHKLLSFAVAYAGQTFDDFDEMTRRRAEVARAWKVT